MSQTNKMKTNSNSVCRVVSKYFVKEAAMEDSFNDFQEKKKIKPGPKIVPTNKKNNQKKSLKRPKVQKDIRSLIKKNELVSYSQDFDKVCKQSGVDVDAEQLQLAIALSKSLNDFQSPSEDVEIHNKLLSSQERSAKIRTTLQEYGFKINKSKILLSLSKNKRKKYNKHSKLLKISSEERQNKILNKYSDILASNICKSPTEDLKCIYIKHTIFYKSTNIPYDHIKNNETFYVANLIDIPTHKTCLLRNWSEIPGRPVSPKPNHNYINFETFQYSQDELDNILSGSIDDAQNILHSKQDEKAKNNLIDFTFIKYNTNNKIKTISSCSNDSIIDENQVSLISDTVEVTEIQIHDIEDKKKINSLKHSVQENIECVDLIEDISFNNNSQKYLKVIDSQNLKSLQFRSTSPDLFDDDFCSIIEEKNDYSRIENKICSEVEDNNHNCTRENISKSDNCGTIFMDLTECINNLNVNKDVTKRKSNDLMDITECVDVKSINNTVDIILSSGETNKDNDLENNLELVDLTQVKNFIYNTPTIEERPTNKDVTLVTDDTVIYDDVVFTKSINENIDLQDSIIICEEDIPAKDVMHDDKISECDNIETERNLRNISKNLEENHDLGDKNNDGINKHLIQGSDKQKSNRNSQSYQKHNEDKNEFGVKKDYDIVFTEGLNRSEDKRNSHENSKNVEDNFEFMDENNDDIKIDLTQGSHKSEGNYSPNYPEFIDDDYGTVTFEHNSGTSYNEDKDDKRMSLKSTSVDNDIENQDDIDLTQGSEKSFEITDDNNDINCPGTSYNNKSNSLLDNNVVIIDNENNSIVSIENVTINSETVEEYNENKIDLTQDTEGIMHANNPLGYTYLEHKNYSKLGKIDNISIDYDEMFDEITSESKNTLKNNSKKDDVNSSNPSINSEVFEISDKELNYSIHHSIHENLIIDFDNTRIVGRKRSLSESYLPTVNLSKPLTPIKEKNNSQSNTPLRKNRDIGDAIIQTPKNNEYIIKTREVTPMADYESMTTPERNKELDKYGIKPFKRKRAIQLLTYVYNQTHPVIESCSPEEGPSKRFKGNNKYTSPKKNSKSPKKCLNFGSDVNKENDIFGVTKETPDIRDIECDPKEWVFQNREKAKVHSCRVPLHIAFHNYVSCRKLLREAILRYEPVNIDIIHKDLVSYGHKYNPKDLLKFMDRKCITVKTVENNLKNKKNVAKQNHGI